MENILLIVSNRNLRQLYHELLMSKDIEVVPLEKISDAVVFLFVKNFDIIVLYIDEQNELEAENFLRLRSKRDDWKTIPVAVLTSFTGTFSDWLHENDLILNPLIESPVQLIEKITEVLSKE